MSAGPRTNQSGGVQEVEHHLSKFFCISSLAGGIIWPKKEGKTGSSRRHDGLTAAAVKWWVMRRRREFAARSTAPLNCSRNQNSSAQVDRAHGGDRAGRGRGHSVGIPGHQAEGVAHGSARSSRRRFPALPAALGSVRSVGNSLTGGLCAPEKRGSSVVS